MRVSELEKRVRAGVDSERYTIVLEGGIVYEEAVEGVRVAVDRVYTVVVNGRKYGEIVAMPVNLEEAALGLVLSEPSMGDPGRASISIGDNWIRIDANGQPATSLTPEDCSVVVAEAGPPTPPSNHYTWGDVYSVYRDFAARTGSSIYKLAIHTTGLYNLDTRKAVIVHDTSRHTAVLKAIGLAYKARLLDPKARLAAITTGRASSDMVTRLARTGVRLVITMRGPLASGLEAAQKTGVTLVSNARREKGRSLVLLTGSLDGQPPKHYTSMQEHD